MRVGDNLSDYVDNLPGGKPIQGYTRGGAKEHTFYKRHFGSGHNIHEIVGDMFSQSGNRELFFKIKDFQKMYTPTEVQMGNIGVLIENKEQEDIIEELFRPTITDFKAGPYKIPYILAKYPYTRRHGCSWDLGTGEYLKKTYKTTVINFEQIEFPEMKKKKVLGYKAPMDLFGGKVKAGSLFELITGVNGVKNEQWYGHGDDAISSHYSRHLPKEIVETWEPVYEPQFKLGDIVTDDNGANLYKIDRIENDRYYSNDGPENSSHLSLSDNVRHCTEEEIKRYKAEKEIPIIRGFKPEKRWGDLKIGCQYFSLQELQAIQRLVGSPIDAKITLGEQIIDSKLIDKLINLIK